ncbi:MAG: RidA family protein [Ahrensia sp.]
MTSEIDANLARLGITIPTAAAPAANYVPYVKSGNLLFTSGQLPLKDGALFATGQVGAALDVEAGQQAAMWCAVNVLAQAKAALGDLSAIKRLVKITVFVSSTTDFTEQHIVANGASNFFVDVLGDAGRHARSAVGMPVLPLNAPVEVEAVIEI